jgi:TPP-dependent pyruvate/acetoin dehydrogenase alpha subunit
VKKIVDDAVAFAEASPAPEGPEAMEDLYATPIMEG